MSGLPTAEQLDAAEDAISRGETAVQEIMEGVLHRIHDDDNRETLDHDTIGRLLLWTRKVAESARWTLEHVAVIEGSWMELDDLARVGQLSSEPTYDRAGKPTRYGTDVGPSQEAGWIVQQMVGSR